VSNAVSDILLRENHANIPYIDDFVGIAPDLPQATVAFDRSSHLFRELGLQESTEKSVPPTTQLTWIGVDFDTKAMTMQIPPAVIQETSQLVHAWLKKHSATRHELQTVMGKLFHSAKCAPPARLFVGRMLATLRAAPTTGTILLSTEFKKDISWFSKFLPTYNGKALIHTERPSTDVHIHSSITHGSVQWEDNITQTPVPAALANNPRLSHHHDLFTLLVGLTLWGASWAGMQVILHTAKADKLDVLLHGKTRDLGLLDLARLVWLTTAKFDILLSPQEHSINNNQRLPKVFCQPPSTVVPTDVLNLL
jgi:hypothetical protein